MGTTKSRNPLGFTPLPVTIITVAVYVALFTGLLYTHHVVPSPPDDPTPVKGINITEAWTDLQVLSAGYHPYNSHQNDVVREWLLTRINRILGENKVRYETKSAVTTTAWKPSTWKTNTAPVTIYNDLISNATYSSAQGPEAIYFEGTNLIVYIRGSEDGETDWWQARDSSTGPRGVLVNAHYDSVSTGFGATDDGVGVVSILQLIKYFTTSGNQPKRGVVALLDNGEEDYLQGARAFTQHPISKFPDTFLDLEGAGAGGRATLLRSTDEEVTKYYKKSPYPFGSIVSSDGFKRGLVRSQTNYVVYTDILHMRGLDVAFMEPRARYHTSEDSTTYTSKASLWHMLSAALATTKGLAMDTKTDLRAGKGSPAVWFDLFGQIFGLMTLRTMFALSITLLIVGPLVMILLAILLRKVDKYWLFASTGTSNSLDPRYPDDDVIVQFKGWRGLFRYPIAFVLASAAVAGLALLVNKLNPYIIYSSEYAVWSMMLCAWFVVAWFFLRGADFMRPSALHRAHSYGWLFAGSWAILVLVTVGENNFGIAGSYALVLYFATVFVALFLSYMEFFALPKKSDVIRRVCNLDDDDVSILTGGRPVSRTSNRRYISDDEDGQGSNNVLETASETTSLLSKKAARRAPPKARVHRRLDETDEEDTGQIHGLKPAYGLEQEWSGSLPSWLWILQFLVTAPVMVVLVGQIGLLLTSALHQTVADGSPALINYASIAILSILLLVPISPFLHRFNSALPTLFFLIFVGTLVYNLLAFPFSENNRLKVYFIQRVNIETGLNHVALTGLDGYVQDVIASLPSAAGQNVQCGDSTLPSRNGLVTCSWEGLAPNVLGSTNLSIVPDYASWLSVNTSRLNNNTNEARISIAGSNTRACKILFNTPISNYDVAHAASHDDRFPRMPRDGAKEIRLWHREWSKPWSVNVKWAGSGGQSGNSTRQGIDGKAVCLWSDNNTPGIIPALDEVRHYMPAWAIVSKFSDGLVEASTSILI